MKIEISTNEKRKLKNQTICFSSDNLILFTKTCKESSLHRFPRKNGYSRKTIDFFRLDWALNSANYFNYFHVKYCEPVTTDLGREHLAAISLSMSTNQKRPMATCSGETIHRCIGASRYAEQRYAYRYTWCRIDTSNASIQIQVFVFVTSVCPVCKMTF